jgi:hypothetical protein
VSHLRRIQARSKNVIEFIEDEGESAEWRAPARWNRNPHRSLFGRAFMN